ncbi:MAG: FKBP-type peptidyl-prolyl cis-trans isomerase [Flavobacteriales bacterium]|nr:FKBP-type peptidyl-prolyl cis-trans isomerase [Flavobacteriales bacterium]
MKIRLLILLILLTGYASCRKDPMQGFTRVTDDTYLKFIHNIDTGVKGTDAYLLLGYAQALNASDSLLDNAFLRDGFYLQVPLHEQRDSSGFMKALLMLSAGDSAIIRIKAISFFQLPAFNQPIPENVDTLSYINVYIRIDNLMNEEQTIVWNEEKENQERAYAYKQFQDYLRLNAITEEPVGSGIYLITEREGKGKSPIYGSKVAIHFMGITITGNEITNSYPGVEPYVFELGSNAVPQGMNEGIARMKKGGKYRIIVPYYLAYGKDGMPPLIPPYTHMIYIVELIDIL